MFKKIGLFIIFFLLTAPSVKATVIDDYQRDLDTYRALNETYEIKKGEFNQFHTFAAEEDLVTAAQDMLLARSDVWIAYWKMLADQLQPEKTLLPDTVTKHLNFYTAETAWLQQHKDRLRSKQRRDELQKEAAALNAKTESYKVESSISTMFLYVGRLQGVTRRLLQLNEALSTRAQAQSFPEPVKSSKLRGLQVNHDRLSSVNDRLNQIEQEYASPKMLSSESTDRIKLKLTPLYDEIVALRQVLAELAEEIEW